MAEWLSWLGTPLQALSAFGIWTGIGYLLLHLRGMKKLQIDAEQVQINANEINGKERADIRDHYAKEVSRYSDQVVGLRDDLEKCEKECARRIDDIEEAHEQRLDKVEKRNRFLERKLSESESQRISEQISLVRIVMDTVPSPQFKTLIKALEAAQASLPYLAPSEKGMDHRRTDNSPELDSAENTSDAAEATVRQVTESEAKRGKE